MVEDWPHSLTDERRPCRDHGVDEQAGAGDTVKASVEEERGGVKPLVQASYCAALTYFSHGHQG
jgi:hypothetical protein